MRREILKHDGPLIVGAGLAGLSAALACAPRHTLVLAPVSLGTACSSAWAQGGIAAALSPEDSPEKHAADTLAAGAGIVDARAARTLTGLGKATVERLSDLGAPFDHNADGTFLLNREAAHGMARVARVGGDLAGKAILQAMVAAARAAPHIDIREGVSAVGLIRSDENTVCGALVRQGDDLIEIHAPSVILATGGLGGLYAVTTNPANLRGMGMAMAALAGALIADPEFVQFHPTALKLGLDPAPLATEAIRGEGGILIDGSGHRFVLDDHPDGELAPRDIVARAVYKADLRGSAFLDATKAIGAKFPHEFPTVFASCMAAGIDPRTTPMPVAPAVHYHMGGIDADTEGRTSLKGLFAVGECASSGVHGANRLASNSLLEAAAFGERAGHAAAQVEAAAYTSADVPPQPPRLPPPDMQILRNAMSRHAGVVRDAEGLKTLLGVIDGFEARYPQALSLVAARLVAVCALRRRESRGSHYRSDFPETSAVANRTYISWTQVRAQNEETA